MIALASSHSQRDPIHLSDAILENSKIIEKALDIIYTYRYDVDLIKSEVNLIKFVIDFAKKWEITMITDIISRGLSSEIKHDLDDGNGQHFEQFLVALHLGDNKLAARAFRVASYHERWASENEEQMLARKADEMRESETIGTHYLSDVEARGLSGNDLSLACRDGGLFNFGAMPYKEFLKIRPTMIWIILRSEILKLERGNDSDEEIVLELLDKACKCSFKTRGCLADPRPTLKIRRIK
jgi:hypothetical protein